jgi:hypothetical protein
VNGKCALCKPKFDSNFRSVYISNDKEKMYQQCMLLGYHVMQITLFYVHKSNSLPS